VSWKVSAGLAARPSEVSPQAAASVEITTAGPDPRSVTILPGETVSWVNHTDETLQIVGGQPPTAYLP
jgi:plastocyanin